MIYQVNKPFHLFTSPENLVKIGPLDSEILGLESRPLKYFFQITKKHIGKIAL